MNDSFHIFNINIVNEGEIKFGELFISNGIITKINFSVSPTPSGFHAIDGENKYIFPGVIDTHVHFREPGLNKSATIFSESRAAVAGGVTSYMDMPNTSPAATNIETLNNKFNIAKQSSMANYSFYIGVSNDNYDEIMRAEINEICGVKIFFASSTGNLKVDNIQNIERIFKSTPHIICAHCEDDSINDKNKQLPENSNPTDATFHPKIRSAESCYTSTHMAIELAKAYNTKLHIAHLSTAIETKLFNNNIPLSQKRITAEACINHLWFNDSFYKEKGNLIKVNPAIKTIDDCIALRAALKQGIIDTVATDHAPHLLNDKMKSYTEAPSGAPMIQHSLQIMIELSKQNCWTLPDIAKYMSHNPATLFQIKKRGFIREGYYADLTIVDLNKSQNVNKDNIHYACKWSPIENSVLNSQICKTFVNGKLAYDNGKFSEMNLGKKLTFDRK